MNPDLPPPDGAIGCYRFMLWMMPTGIALTTAFGFGWLYSVIQGTSHHFVFGWIILSTLASVGIGIFEAKLRDQSEPPALLGFRSRVILFFLLQLLIIFPALSFAVVAACAFVGS